MMRTSVADGDQRTHDGCPTATAGFTLLEVLLVLGIISLVSLLLIPQLGNPGAGAFAAQIQEVTVRLNQVRREAVLRGRPGTLRLLASEADSKDSAAMASSAEVMAYWQSGGLSLGFYDSTDHLTEDAGSIDITFFPEGGSTGGTLLLELESRQARIHIDPFTGRISHETVAEATR